MKLLPNTPPMTPKKPRKHSLLKTTQSIKKKLEELKSLTIDRIGYEKKIKINVLRFFALAAKTERLGLQRMKIHLYALDEQVVGFLCIDEATTRSLSHTEISELFLGQPSYSILVLARIKRCLMELATVNAVPLDQLMVILRISNCIPLIDLYDDGSFLKTMMVKELIRFFKI